MRRIYIFLLLLLLSLTAVLVVAQEDPSPDEPTAVSPITPDAATTTPEPPATVANPFMNPNGGSFSINAGEGADLCSAATGIGSPGGAQMDVAALTQSMDDPILNCMWGSPSSLQGYRTVWYKFTPEYNATVTLTTLPASPLATNAYDTVLAVHSGSCGALTTLACNDDFIGFSSAVTLEVRRGREYYIEVADWQAGGNAIKLLDLSLQIEPFDTLWEPQNSQPLTLTTRQASLIIGSNLYLIGGRGANGSMVNSFQKLDTTTGAWEPLSPMPGDGLLNTTAVYLPPGNNTGSNGRIYLPGGSISANDQVYSREHVYYDIGVDGWSPIAVPPLANVGGSHVAAPFAYAAAARNKANDGYFLTGGVVGRGYPFTTTATVHNQVLLYNPAHDTWTPRAPMTSPRYGHVAAYLATAPANRQLCVAGGLNIDGGQTVLIPNGECASAVSPSTWTPTGNMQVPRYFAHSSVAANGMWFVYGGVDGSGAPVPEVEVYNPATNSWSVLGLRYDLGGQEGKPIVWPGGGFIGVYLWTAGGSYDPTGLLLNPQVAKTEVKFLNPSLYLPFITNSNSDNNHSFDSARRIAINTSISQNFASSRQLVNVYRFEVTQQRAIQVALTDVAADARVNLYLYNNNKLVIEDDDSPFPGIDKTITASLLPGAYYVMVRYLYSPNANDIDDYYQLRISN